MITRSALPVAVVLALVSSASAAPIPTRLRITGAFQTTSERAATSGQKRCGFRTSGRVLIYESEALRIGRGSAVASIAFQIPHFRGLGRYDARTPAAYSRTAVQVVTARNATTGVASGHYVATSGSVSITESKNVGRVGHSGSVGGTVRAELRLQRGSKRLRLDGSWRCRIDPTSNGG